MNLDKRVQALESRTDQGERVETISIVGVKPDQSMGRRFSWVRDSDDRFTSVPELSL